MSGCPAGGADHAALIERAKQHLLRVVVVDDTGARRWASIT
jgi:hypothetical protein